MKKHTFLGVDTGSAFSVMALSFLHLLLLRFSLSAQKEIIHLRLPLDGGFQVAPLHLLRRHACMSAAESPLPVPARGEATLGRQRDLNKMRGTTT